MGRLREAGAWRGRGPLSSRGFPVCTTTPPAFLTAAALLTLAAGPARADALARLKADRLEAVHRAVRDLRPAWQKLPRPGPYQDYRSNLHVHSALSHDSR